MNREFVNAVVKELKKHAERDDCYECKQLLKQLAKLIGVDLETLKNFPIPT